MALSASAQVTFPVKMGFEDADKSENFHCKFANTVGVSEFGDWVNPQSVDNWIEQSKDDPKSGDYCFMAQNDVEKKNPWDRGFKLANLPIQDGKSYRMSFWLKGETGKVLKAYISKGVEQLDKSFINPKGTACYGLNGSDDYTISTDEWKHVAFVAYNHGAQPYNDVLANTSWMGGATVGDCVPQSLWEAAGINESNKDKSYRDFWGGTIPEIYFAIINLYDGGTFYVDDICIDEDVYFGQATYNRDVIKLDFGYNTNVSTLANAEKKKCIFLDKTQFSVKDANGAEAEIISVEGHSDGYVYIYLADGDAEGATVSFTPNAECPLVYAGDKRPTNDYDNDMKVLGFTNEPTYEDSSIEAEMIFTTLPTLVSSVPEDGSFDLDGSLSEFTLIFDAAVDPANSIIKLIDEKEKETDLTVSQGADEKTLVAKTDGSKLKNGKYILNIEAGNEAGDANFYDLTFSIGATGFDPNSSTETMFEAAFDEDGDNTAPKRGTMVSGDEGGTNMTPGEGRGSGPRVFNTGSVSELYLRDWSGSNYYYEIGTRADELLTLSPGTNKVSFKYAMWKEGTMNLNVQVFAVDEEGNATDEIIAEETFTENVNTNGDKAAFANAPVGELKFDIETEGNYGIRFKGTGEYLIGDIEVIYVPNIAGIEYKTKLWNAVVKAYEYYCEVDPQENARYDEKEFDELLKLIEKYANTTDSEPADWTALGMTSPSDYENATAAVNEALKTAQEFKTYVDEYDAYRMEGGTVDQALAKYADTKYASLKYYTVLKETYEKYKDQALTDLDELKSATNTLKDNLYLLKMACGTGVSLTDYHELSWELVGKVGIPALTARIDMAYATIESMNPDYTDEEAAVMMAVPEAMTDDDNLAESLKKIATKYYYTAMTDDATAKSFFEAQYADIDEEGNGGEQLSDGTYNFSFFLKNPNIYIQTSPTKNNPASSLDQTNIGTEEEPEYIYSGAACPGWVVSDGTGGYSNGWGSLAWNEEIAEEAMFSNWGGAFTVSQMIEDLPAGLYVLKAGITERNETSSATDAESAFFWQTSSDEEPVTMMIPSSGQSWKTENISSARREAEFDETGNEVVDEEAGASADADPIEILDGNLVIGAHAGPDSHVFINNFSIYLVGKSATYDYKKGLADGIENAINDNSYTVAVYDLNGRRIVRATKGVNIVKRTYSNGRVVTSKVLVK